MKIKKLFGDRVLVWPEKHSDRSSAGLTLVKKFHPPATGIVYRVGDRVTKGMNLKEGDRISFRPFSGTELVVDGLRLRMFKSEELLGKIVADVTVLEVEP